MPSDFRMKRKEFEMKSNTSTFREVKIVKFFEPSIMKWDPNTAPVAVKCVATNEIFTLYESQLKRIRTGKNDQGHEEALWGYIQEKVRREV